MDRPANLVIRPAAPAEFAEIAELTVSAFRTLPDASAGASYEPHLRDVAGRAATSLVLVAESDGRLVGSVTYVRGPGPEARIPDADAGSIRMLAVASDARGRGVGRALVEACIAEARAARRQRVLLDTRTTMTSAQRLYERLGFRRVPALDWSPSGEVELLAYAFEL